MEQVIAWIKTHVWQTIGIAIGVLVVGSLILGLFAFNTVDSARKGGKGREAGLTAQYLDNQNELSNHVVSLKEALGIANIKAEKLEVILVEAIKGRYEGTAGTPGSGDRDLINAIVEAYPDLGDLNSYDRVLDLARSGREAYKNKQSKLLDMLREYDTWRDSGIIDSLIRGAMFPSDRLEARVGPVVYTGDEARSKMYQIVLVGEALDAYESGETEPVIDGTQTTEEGNG